MVKISSFNEVLGFRMKYMYSWLKDIIKNKDVRLYPFKQKYVILYTITDNIDIIKTIYLHMVFISFEWRNSSKCFCSNLWALSVV